MDFDNSEGNAFCLDNVPAISVVTKHSNVQKPASYDLDEQCQLQFGKNSSRCEDDRLKVYFFRFLELYFDINK